MSQHIIMRSRKQHIRLWFECLQICYTDPKYFDNLEKSKDFYQDWGDIRDIKFDDWWKDKKYLFEDMEVHEVDRVSKKPNTITLSIPLTKKITDITKQVKEIVEKRQIEKLDEMGVDHSTSKSKRVRGGEKYQINAKEIKGKMQYVNLEVYKIYLKLNKPPINRQFLVNVRQEFDDRPRSKLKNSMVNLPQIRDFDKLKTNVDLDDVIRSVRRSCIRQVERTLMNVSNGRFP